MSGPTHATIGTSGSLWLLYLAGQQRSLLDLLLVVLTAVFFSWLPDMDHERASIHKLTRGWSRGFLLLRSGFGLFFLVALSGLVWLVLFGQQHVSTIVSAFEQRPIAMSAISSVLATPVLWMSFGVSRFFQRHVRQRGATHSFLFWAAVSLVSVLVFDDRWLAMVGTVCYLLHILADMLTEYGCQLLWPWPVEPVKWRPGIGFYRFGSKKVLRDISPILDVLLFWLCGLLAIAGAVKVLIPGMNFSEVWRGFVSG